MLLLTLLIVGADNTAFAIEAPEAKKVEFASDLTDWKPVPMKARGRQWSIAYDLPREARIEYQFIVDGQWMLDPKNKATVDNGIGGRNSVWTGLGYRATRFAPSPITWKKSAFPLRYGSSDRSEVVVYTPSIPGKADMPCLVMFDGPDYVARGRALDIAGNLISKRQITPIQFVFFKTVKDRSNELWRQSSDYESMVVGAIKGPLRSAITADSQKRYTGGASLGGYFGLLLLRKYPDTFAGGLLSQSGAFYVAKDQHTTEALKPVPRKARIFLDYGEYEKGIKSGNLELAPRLKPRIVTMVHSYEGHNWTAWRERLPLGLKALFGTSKKQ
ncbi:MAG: hypothetical protein HONBIEJF_02422 [Fimbriimonadaceae bacterium]|nr:hypothetical protein [Fimbriimonadaceae bacterium]